MIAAERDSQKIAVEVKSFISPSPLNDLENAWGQFFLYARALRKQEPARRLYLAVSRNVFETLFMEEAGQLLLAKTKIHPTSDPFAQRLRFGVGQCGMNFWAMTN